MNQLIECVECEKYGNNPNHQYKDMALVLGFGENKGVCKECYDEWRANRC